MQLYPIHKATIIPRGRALGMVMNLPERDDTILSRTITCSTWHVFWVEE